MLDPPGDIPYKIPMKIKNNIKNHVHANMTGKLQILCNFNRYHSICTTLLYKILFTEF